MLSKINQCIYWDRIRRKYQYSNYKRQKLIYNINNNFLLKFHVIYNMKIYKLKRNIRI